MPGSVFSRWNDDIVPFGARHFMQQQLKKVCEHRYKIYIQAEIKLQVQNLTIMELIWGFSLVLVSHPKKNIWKLKDVKVHFYFRAIKSQKGHSHSFCRWKWWHTRLQICAEHSFNVLLCPHSLFAVLPWGVRHLRILRQEVHEHLDLLLWGSAHLLRHTQLPHR